MKTVGIALGIIVGAILLFALVIIGIRNGLINKEETVNQQWSEVENQLQRRYDLIPNLANTVKGYAKHEKEVFTNLANARAAMSGAKTPEAIAKASSELESAISRLLVVVENYPQLKANVTFIRMMDELAGTENRIAVARQRYNTSVKEFNTSIKQFPGCMFGFEKKQYFDPPAKEKMNTAPKVEF